MASIDLNKHLPPNRRRVVSDIKTQQTLPSATDKPVTPCVRNCCLDEQDICLGCFRSLNEILTWRAASDTEKQTTLERCRHRRQCYHQQNTE